MSEARRPTFDEVLRSARVGSPRALGWLYRRFQPGLLRTLAVIAPHRADDVASDVWLDVAGGLSRFTGDEREFRGWLAATARHRVIDGSRRPGRRRERSMNGDPAVAAAFAAQVAGLLPPDQADVVVMRVVDGLDVDEVARAMGRAPEAVRGIQHRALRRLARELDPDVLPASRGRGC